MQFGSFMEFHRREGGTQAEAFREAFAHVALAEDLGLDAVWLAESHFNPARSVLSSPHAIASAIAARTRRLRVGTAVSVLPLGNPLRTAEEAATIDHISEGRFDFGVGRSGLPGSYEGYNIPYAESRERFYEYLDIIMTAWREERFSYDGDFFSYNDVCLVPKPYQTPHPPIRIAANTSDTFPVLGEMGFPVFVGVRQQSLDGGGRSGGELSCRMDESGPRRRHRCVPARASLCRRDGRRRADRAGRELYATVQAAGRAVDGVRYPRRGACGTGTRRARGAARRAGVGARCYRTEVGGWHSSDGSRAAASYERDPQSDRSGRGIQCRRTHPGGKDIQLTAAILRRSDPRIKMIMHRATVCWLPQPSWPRIARITPSSIKVV